jgi:hypothetical protein
MNSTGSAHDTMAGPFEQDNKFSVPVKDDGLYD